MEEGGFRKKKGCLGRALESSLMWSLGHLIYQHWKVIYTGWRRTEGAIRIVPAYADYFTAVGFDGSHYYCPQERIPIRDQIQRLIAEWKMGKLTNGFMNPLRNPVLRISLL